MKVSDRILCIKGDHLFKEGQPDEIFDEEMIRQLYDINNGFFDPLFGSIELPKVGGEAKTLVLSSCGRGVPVYRRLQKANVPFIAGILTENDIDYQLARLLAEDIIMSGVYETLSDEVIQKALCIVDKCDQVIDAGVVIGETNAGIAKILEAARTQGKLEKM